MPEWIKTADKLPQPFISVLIHTPGDSPLPTVHEGYMAEDNIWHSVYFHEPYTLPEVTHWMPMPKPPKKEGEADG